MKSRLFEKVMFFIYTVIIIVLSLCVLGISIGVIPPGEVSNFFEQIEYRIDFAAIGVIVSVVFLVVSIRLLFAGVAGRKPTSSLIQNTELGMIRVSTDTLDTLTRKAVRSFNEVKDVKTAIVTEMDGIRIRLKLVLMPDVKIPDLTRSIQKKVKEYVESLSGVIVKDVQVYVHNLFTPQHTRVE